MSRRKNAIVTIATTPIPRGWECRMRYRETASLLRMDGFAPMVFLYALGGSKSGIVRIRWERKQEHMVWDVKYEGLQLCLLWLLEMLSRCNAATTEFDGSTVLCIRPKGHEGNHYGSIEWKQ